MESPSVEGGSLFQQDGSPIKAASPPDSTSRLGPQQPPPVDGRQERSFYSAYASSHRVISVFSF